MTRTKLYFVPDTLGCFVNAIPFLDKACSGKKTCDYSLPSRELIATKPCPRGVASYLEVDYECVKGMCFPCSPIISTSDSTTYAHSLQLGGWTIIRENLVLSLHSF